MRVMKFLLATSSAAVEGTVKRALKENDAPSASSDPIARMFACELFVKTVRIGVKRANRNAETLTADISGSATPILPAPSD